MPNMNNIVLYTHLGGVTCCKTISCKNITAIQSQGFKLCDWIFLFNKQSIAGL